MQSSGRGGAGNIVDSSKAPQIQPKDLETPTLKSEMVTTGRGGTGNMAANLDAEEKRRLQDVEPCVSPTSRFPVPVHSALPCSDDTVRHCAPCPTYQAYEADKYPELSVVRPRPPTSAVEGPEMLSRLALMPLTRLLLLLPDPRTY